MYSAYTYHSALVCVSVAITLHYEHLKFYPLLISLLNVAVSKIL